MAAAVTATLLTESVGAVSHLASDSRQKRELLPSPWDQLIGIHREGFVAWCGQTPLEDLPVAASCSLLTQNGRRSALPLSGWVTLGFQPPSSWGLGL